MAIGQQDPSDMPQRRHKHRTQEGVHLLNKDVALLETRAHHKV